MRIAVVIPAWNEEDRIANTIACARATAGGEIEVFVVDGGSQDSTCERAREAGARVVSSERGRARQLQAGALAAADAGADAVLFLHADTELPEGHAEAVRQAFEASDVVGGAFGLVFDERSLGMRVIEWGVRMRLRLASLPFGDQGIFARTTALAKIGGVPQVPIMEDIDLVRALQARGRFVQLDAAAVTSARRYRSGGVLRTVVKNFFALMARAAGIDRARIAAWYRQ